MKQQKIKRNPTYPVLPIRMNWRYDYRLFLTPLRTDVMTQVLFFSCGIYVSNVRLTGVNENFPSKKKTIPGFRKTCGYGHVLVGSLSRRVNKMLKEKRKDALKPIFVKNEK